MKVCIAEKPSVAQEIARVIGATRRCEGYFEGNGYDVDFRPPVLPEIPRGV